MARPLKLKPFLTCETKRLRGAAKKPKGSDKWSLMSSGIILDRHLTGLFTSLNKIEMEVWIWCITLKKYQRRLTIERKILWVIVNSDVSSLPTWTISDIPNPFWHRSNSGPIIFALSTILYIANHFSWHTYVWVYISHYFSIRSALSLKWWRN